MSIKTPKSKVYLLRSFKSKRFAIEQSVHMKTVRPYSATFQTSLPRQTNGVWNSNQVLVSPKTICTSKKTCKNIPYLYLLKGVALDSVKEIKYLGVTISHDLRWSKHIADVVSRSNKVLGLLKRNLPSVTNKSSNEIYRASLRTMLEYASIIWDPRTQQT